VQGDPAVLARVYTEHLGLEELYVADLDAIAGGAEHHEAIRDIAAKGAALWLDAGISTTAQAERGRGRGASRVIVGLETLTSFESLRSIVEAVGAAGVAFSLDLRDGRPITADATLADLSIDTLAREATDAGVGSIIVLDLALIGSSRGFDVPVVDCVRRAAPEVTLVAGGGIRDVEELRRLTSAGCDGALVATALHGTGAAELVRTARHASVHA
jgi:phosphoribosylformimino-5-aminoimidazole carboxamide ribotide isomerase